MASGDTISFKAGTGTTYSTEELVGKITDGANVEVNKGGKVIARDFADTDKNITIEEAVSKMKSALVQANSVGATVSGATVTTEIKASGTVQTIDNGGTVTAKDALIAVKGNQMIQIKATDDITEYAKTGSGYKLYKAGTPTLDNGKFKENALYVCSLSELLTKKPQKNEIKKDTPGYGGKPRKYWGYGGFIKRKIPCL